MSYDTEIDETEVKLFFGKKFINDILIYFHNINGLVDQSREK
jgi:hypothetical protein